MHLEVFPPPPELFHIGSQIPLVLIVSYEHDWPTHPQHVCIIYYKRGARLIKTALELTGAGYDTEALVFFTLAPTPCKIYFFVLDVTREGGKSHVL